MLEAARGLRARRHRRRRRLRRAARPRRDRAPARRPERLPTCRCATAASSGRNSISTRRCSARPAILLVDELAHSNLVRRRAARRATPKRWQDIEELLDAGINVWTTVNVQHLESLNDLVAQITGVRQRETVPDRVFDEADEVELIDLPPDDLLARLQRRQGLRRRTRSATAVERFFRKPNLMALRELALRRTADRVDAAARDATRPATRTSRPGWRATASWSRSARTSRPSSWCAPASAWPTRSMPNGSSSTSRRRRCCGCPRRERNRRIDAAAAGRVAGRRDGHARRAVGGRSARSSTRGPRNVTRVVVGAPKRRGWRAWLRPSTTTELVRRARGFDVVDDRAPTRAHGGAGPAHGRADATAPQPIRWERYAGRCAITAVCTALAFADVPVLRADEPRDGLPAGRRRSRALRLGRGPSVLTAVANVAAFDFFFVPPRFTFAVSDVQYLVTFAVMLIVALVIATLMASVRQQTRVAGARERRTALLYAMSRELAATRGIASMARVAVRTWPKCSSARRSCCCRTPTGTLQLSARVAPLGESLRGADLAVAQWVIDHGAPAGLGTDTLPAAPGAVPAAAATQRAAPRRAGGAAGATAARAAAGAAAPARDLRRPDRAGARARAAGRRGGGRARRGREREPAQHAARLDLARPAHAARGDRRRRQHARRARRDARRGHARRARRARSKTRRARCRS